MQRDLHGLRILVTGASGGIGQCLARQAAQRGARVALAARSADKLEELAASLAAVGAEAVAILADITLESDRQRLLQTVAERFGGLDVLINNAAAASCGEFAGSSESILRQVMEVNFFAPAELIRLAVPMLTVGHQPAIVNIASLCGRRGLPAWTEYSASKFALCGLTEALRGEMARFDIDVLLALPGAARSDWPRRPLRNEGPRSIAIPDGMTPDAVAAAILQCLQENRTESVLRCEARWLLRLNRFFPRLVDRLMARKGAAVADRGLRMA